MCHRVKCRRCGKTTWAGCGAHVQQVMASVPQEKRCNCTASEKAAIPATTNPILRWLRGE